MSVEDVRGNTFLIHLGLARCGLTRVDNVTLLNLHSLDLTHNLLTSLHLQHLARFPRLRELKLSGNPLTSLVKLVKKSAS
jgi:Leucine-rich repeat (LRR) protein